MSTSGRFLISSMDQDRLTRLIGNNFAYHALAVTLPRLDVDTDSWNFDVSVYETLSLSLVDILEPEFIEKVKKG